MKRVSQKFAAGINTVVIGTGDKALAIGGEHTLPLYSFDEPMRNPPRVGVEVSDRGVNRELAGIAAFYTEADNVPAMAQRACSMPGASFISLTLESADPNGENRTVADCVALCKAVADAVSLPLVIQGCKNVEKDARLFVEIAEALRGRNVLLLSAREENYKAIAAGAALANQQKIGAESAVDLNLAKQLNVLVSQLGVSGESVVMNVGSAAAGYGFEYVASTMDRVKGVALAQNDTMLQMPIITPVASEAWVVKEAVVSEEDAPTDWGPTEQRGIDMEVATAAAAIAAGADAVILRHPVSVKTIADMVSAFV
jgi:acetyl-CoA decarbonylase/synthase complex subunit delta